MAEQRPFTRAAVTRIRDIRKQRGVTAEELAARMTAAGYRMERTWITKAETGRREQIPIDWVAAASEALGVPLSALLGCAKCMRCGDAPPPGFACIACGIESPA